MKFEFYNKKSGAFLAFTDNLQNDDGKFSESSALVKI